VNGARPELPSLDTEMEVLDDRFGAGWPSESTHHAASLPTSGRVPTVSTSPCSPGDAHAREDLRGHCPRGLANARLRVRPRKPLSLRCRRYRAAAPARRRRDRREHQRCRPVRRGRARRSRSPAAFIDGSEPRSRVAARTVGAHEQRAALPSLISPRGSSPRRARACVGLCRTKRRSIASGPPAPTRRMSTPALRRPDRRRRAPPRRAS
jgi:hypothetical protein